mgnify:CR=1 FL=1
MNKFNLFIVKIIDIKPTKALKEYNINSLVFFLGEILTKAIPDENKTVANN